MTSSESEAVHSRILTQAIDDYLNTIPDHDPLKAKLKTDLQITIVQVLLRHVKVLERGFSNRSGYTRLLDRLSLVIEQFERFTRVECCGSMHPVKSDVVGTYMGRIQVLTAVSKVAIEFRGFFEKLVRMIEKITIVLPDYELFLESFLEVENLQRHVVSVYVDILDFWRQATEVFLKRGKSMARQEISGLQLTAIFASGTRSSASVVWQITWKPFDLRFKDIVTRFEDNCVYATHHTQAL
ncbi:hypothetical protein BDD12DRAFT_888070 [Trichophaea hybrida]|nr:hypothetical protein BDD12DRAFT_888070 [Trichophaea hybrida]